MRRIRGVATGLDDCGHPAGSARKFLKFGGPCRSRTIESCKHLEVLRPLVCPRRISFQVDRLEQLPLDATLCNGMHHRAFPHLHPPISSR